MLMIVSPAKTLDFDTPAPALSVTRPEYARDAGQLIDRLRALAPAQLGELMDISPDLAVLNAGRYAAWSRRAPARKTRPAVLAFRGDVYLGLDAPGFDAAQMAFAQQHLRILSGLYGVLRPLDLIQAHRLEMGTRLETAAARNLYGFWGPRIARSLRRQASAVGADTLVNLASQEYFRALDTRALALPVLAPVFKERRGGQLRIVSFSAKRARGLMARFAIRNRITKVHELREFEEDGYRFEPRLSSTQEWLFARDAPAPRA